MSTKQLRLFFIDDDEEYVEDFCKEMATVGLWDVKATVSTSIGRRLIANEHFDLYLIDHKLREHMRTNTGDGGDFLKEILKSKLYNPRSPRVLYSGIVTSDANWRKAAGNRLWLRVFDYYQVPKLKMESMRKLSSALHGLWSQHVT